MFKKKNLKLLRNFYGLISKLSVDKNKSTHTN